MGATVPEIKKLNLDALRPSPRPMQPIEQPNNQKPFGAMVDQPRRDWLKIGLVCAVVFLITYIAFDRGVIPVPGPPQPDIAVDGLHVMLLQPSDQESLTPGQKEFLRSAKVADWVEENGGEFRSYPQSQNIDQESKVWRDIRAELSPPLVVGVLNDRKLTKIEAPNGIDEGIQVLEDLK